MIVKKRKLGKVADAVTVLLLADHLPEDSQAAAAGAEKMEQKFDGRRFAGAIGAEKAKDLVLLNNKGQPVQCQVAPATGAKGLAQVVDFDGWSVHA